MWGGAGGVCKKTFTLQKKIFSIMVGAMLKYSYLSLFKRLEVLLLPSAGIHINGFHWK
jgi:hypothetical protein